MGGLVTIFAQILDRTLAAFGLALISGAREALLYDTLKEVGIEKESKKYFGILNSTHLAGILIAAPVGSWMAGYIGLIFTFLGLIYIPILKPENPMLRTLYNILFVVGFALILVVVDNSGSPSYDYLTIGFSMFWMYTRIKFSNWGHNKICNQCDNPCNW